MSYTGMLEPLCQCLPKILTETADKWLICRVFAYLALTSLVVGSKAGHKNMWDVQRGCSYIT